MYFPNWLWTKINCMRLTTGFTLETHWNYNSSYEISIFYCFIRRNVDFPLKRVDTSFNKSICNTKYLHSAAINNSRSCVVLQKDGLKLKKHELHLICKRVNKMLMRFQRGCDWPTYKWKEKWLNSNAEHLGSLISNVIQNLKTGSSL